MHGMAMISGAAGGANGGISTMYKVMYIVVIYAAYKRSDTNG
jgi:hypothetical protein